MPNSSYLPLFLYIDGAFVEASDGRTMAVENPADRTELGRLPVASTDDVDRATRSAAKAFRSWKNSSTLERSDILRRAANLLRDRADAIALNMSRDQGKPVTEAVLEVLNSADHIDWHAEEGRRIYGRVVPARQQQVRQLIVREPLGVCAAFTPWNFPMSQAVKKVAAGLACGCTVVLKGPEEAPSALVALARVFDEAGLPAGCLNLLFGVPADISDRLIDSPDVATVSFTGSVPVGKALAAKCAARMKRFTMELGGHAPVIICDDADLDRAVELLAPFKFRNAGQVCVSPTRFFVQAKIFDHFTESFVNRIRDIKIGRGTDSGNQMGPLIHQRRRDSVAAFVDDARRRGSTIIDQALPTGLNGYFYPPTVVLDPPSDSLLMQDEPFGPVAAFTRFDDLSDALETANSLPFGLAAYAFTEGSRNAHRIATELQAGMVNINHFGMSFPELPFGGVKESGVGSEGGTETFDGFLFTKLITHYAG